MKWKLVYKSVYNKDGSLFFPERLSAEFLESQKKTMGSYLFANQYLNEIIPDEERVFRPEWIKYYTQLPAHKNTFIFIDPAIGQEDGHDYTGIVVVDVDADKRWYVKYAQRKRLNPTQIINLIFDLYSTYKPNVIGIEEVAFQKVLLYLVVEEMKRRGVNIPIKGIHPGPNERKAMRINVLSPRFEWGNILLTQGLFDLELELSTFPRGSHDDILDALAYVEYIVTYPEPLKESLNERPHPSDPRYEAWYINNLRKRG